MPPTTGCVGHPLGGLRCLFVGGRQNRKGEANPREGRFSLRLVTRSLGAGDETRTRDSLLGRQVLYQLSYPRVGLK